MDHAQSAVPSRSLYSFHSAESLREIASLAREVEQQRVEDG